MIIGFILFLIQAPSGFLSFSTMPDRLRVDPVYPRFKNDFRSSLDALEGVLTVSLESLHRLIGALISKDVDLRGSCDRMIRTICKEPSDIALLACFTHLGNIANSVLFSRLP